MCRPSVAASPPYGFLVCARSASSGTNLIALSAATGRALPLTIYAESEQTSQPQSRFIAPTDGPTTFQDEDARRPFTSIVTAMRAEPSSRPAGAVGTNRSRWCKTTAKGTRVHRRTEILRNRPTQFGRQQNAARSHFTHMISFSSLRR